MDEVYYDETYESVKEELLSNEKFFSETFKSIRKNNPYLACFMSKIAMTAKENSSVKTKISQMSLIAMKIAGATDKNSPDFIVISQEAIMRGDIGAVMLTDDSERLLGEIRSCVSYLNSAYNAGGDEEIPFQSVWPVVKRCCEVTLLEGQWEFQKIKETLEQANELVEYVERKQHKEGLWV